MDPQKNDRINIEKMDEQIANQVIQNINQGIVITDNRGRITKANKRFLKLAGYEGKDLIGTNFLKLNYLDYDKNFLRNIILVLQEKGKWQGEVITKASDGSVIPELLSIYPVKREDGKITNYFGIFIDLKEIKDKEQALWEAKNQLQTIIEYSPLGIIACHKDGSIHLWNKKAENILGYRQSEVIGERIQKYIPNFAVPLHFENNERDIYVEGNEILTFTSTGEQKILDITCSPIYNQEEEVNGFQLIFSDVTDYKEAKRRVEYFKYYDQSTGLYNHDYFYHSVHSFLENNPNEKSAVIVIDIDRFHTINKKFGSRFADKIIKEAGNRIKAAVRQKGIVSSLKGDEFGCFIEGIKDEEEVIQVCRKIFNNFHEPLMVNGQPIHISVSMGISIYPDDGDNYEQLSITANLALSQAKKERNAFRLYDKTLHEDDHFFYENELFKALKEEKLEVHYQPQVDLQTKKIFGVEALLRWNHPKEGYISPGVFIPIAEESGLIGPITDFVIHRVCKDYNEWKKLNLNVPSISINFSASQFYNEDFVNQFMEILNQYNVPKEVIHIEITETVAMDITNSLDNLNKLKEQGIKISIDDFGTGYSSLKYLQELPIDFLKIDKSFIRMISEGKTSMVDFIIQIAKASGMKVVGEGVESEGEDIYLKKRGCTIGQGFYYSRPLAPKKLIRQLQLEKNA